MLQGSKQKLTTMSTSTLKISKLRMAVIITIALQFLNSSVKNVWKVLVLNFKMNWRRKYCNLIHCCF